MVKEGGPDHEMSPVEILAYAEEIGRTLARNALEARAMIEEAREKGIRVDLAGSEMLKKFAPLGEHEKALVKIRAELGQVKGELAKQGVKMTFEDMKSRIGKMTETGKGK